MGQPIAIEAVKPLVRSTIAAHTFFTSQTVLDDNGDSMELEEAALNNPALGQCVTVLPLLDAELMSLQGHGAALLRVGLAVRFAVNPAKHQLDVLEMMRKGTGALLAYSIADKRDCFSVAPKAFIISDGDPGLLAYTCFFEKACVMRYTD